MTNPVVAKLSASLPRDIHKGMICTPARFLGQYEDEQFLIAHAWPTDYVGMNIRFGQKSAASKHYYIVAFKAPAEESFAGGRRTAIPDYTPLLGEIVDLLAVFFGKQFNSCGMIESSGLYHIPHLSMSLTGYYDHYPYNDLPRPDLEIDLNLSRCGGILGLLTDAAPSSRLSTLAGTAAKFYARALRTYEHDHGAAFVDLMMAGEIISKYQELPQDEIYDDQLKKLFARLHQAGIGESDVRAIKGRLYQVKRHFVRNLLGLLSPKFFDKTECSGLTPIEHVRLRADDIEKRLRSAYDLRSRYVHEGIPLDYWMRPEGRDELRWGSPITGNKELDKIVGNAPTFYGMERIIRFCLLRLLHKHVMPLHPDLD
ncbi:HEPN domain-containing protein [Polyangium mundeleinium]|uniref:HEPN domain-containing protein n=1 Tax=Polyangium mundeleinium TaxID=2995306 RepID=A0ABT5EU39_9BACT|nr:HEPN domain-containing protein [Polyangium mundeleinium]MDC0745333.1 HEPN domain-containing protein [Polyangium mundeleinium]